MTGLIESSTGFSVALMMVGLLTASAQEPAAPASDAEPAWTLACAADNDLYRVLVAGGARVARRDSPAAAVAGAAPGAAVLLLADGYPERPTAVDAAVFAEAARKKLRLYVEYPAALPDMQVGQPEDAKRERCVVASDFFGAALPAMRVVMVNGCRYVPVNVASSHLVLAKVAGVDTAVFGLKDTPTAPLLFDHPSGSLLVATSAFSHFVTGRYMPQEAWRTVWQTILKSLQPAAALPALRWTPTVRPAHGRDEALPADVEAQALRRSVDWVGRSRILRHSAWPKEALERALHYNTVRDMPAADWPAGDGSLGILEGFSSAIRADGSQPMRYAVRNDCMSEVALLLALGSASGADPRQGAVAANLADYVLSKSGLAGGQRADPAQPEYGLIGWALDHPGSYWGDDNARGILGVLAAAGALKERRWDDAMTRCVLANFRTTGVYGYRPECLDSGALQRDGWRHYWEGRGTKYSPHYEAWLWPCFLWAYHQTRFEPLLERTRTGARMLMAAYPDRWYWCNRSGSIERARALLPLAWLVRADDTPEHRAWLRRVAEDLVTLQDPCGAIRETIGGRDGHGLASNAQYGSGETTLIQANGDPVADMLYTCNFALIGLHEAAAATGDPFYAAAEDKLARFLCRIQVRSEAHPELDGAWYRAFNFGNWDYWASNADWEWGPWCTETGWTQPWIAGTLALRQMKTSLWDLLARVPVSRDFDRLRREMLPDEALQAGAVAKVRNAALGAAVTLTTPADARYPGGGPGGLTDGQVGGTGYEGPEWMGFEGKDLDATVDLGEPAPIRGLAAGFLESRSVGIYLPPRIEFSVSDDGATFRSAVALEPLLTPRGAGAARETLSSGPLNLRARYVRVRAANRGVIPEGQPGAGRAAWLFVDEVLVNPAPDKEEK